MTKDDDVRNIIFGESGIHENLNEETIIIDHTTTSADLPKEINDSLKLKNCKFLDAPLSGGQIGAEKGQLTVMVGGEEQSYKKVQDIIECYSKFIKYMGSSGSGQLTKMVNQICIGGLIQSLAEGMNFSDKVGLNINDVISVISKGAAQSWQMENRWKTCLLYTSPSPRD